MIKEKISSQEIIDLVASKASVSKRAAEEFLKVMIASIEEALIAGEVVKIKNFGTFKLQWNEPRKSVNIQSGEEIKINGYYKAGFIPDAALKQLVNEPFSHLEPVELDGEIKKNELIDETELVSDPLRLFNEQASEIKNLISEIHALSPNLKSVIPNEKKEQTKIIEEEILEIPQNEKESIVISKDDDLTLNEEEQLEIESIESTLNIKEEKGDEIKTISSENVESQKYSELSSAPYLDNLNVEKKGRKWIMFLLIFVLIIGLGCGFSIFYPPAREYSKETIANCQYSVSKMTENISISEFINSVSKWFTPAQKPAQKAETIVIPKDTNKLVAINQPQPVDSLQILFDNPRVYKDFLAAERITSGNRLTIISKRYYGSKDFWVYIFEANKERLSNPDNIPVGTLIRIPKLDQRLIDITNTRCIEKAKELHDIYVK
jgi:nucleoid DNA-binding protein